VNLLQACLQSLKKQLGVAAEWIVVDNGSNDGSAAMVRREFPEARMIENAVNRGFCEANNQGIAIARGEWVALLNNDAIANPDWLKELIAAANGSGVGMVASKILVADRESVIDKVGHEIYWDGQNRGRGSGEADRGQYDGEPETLWPDGCAALYRRAMLEEIGGFDEDFFAYADDADLGLRGRLMGWKAVYAPKAVVRHHRGSTMGKTNLRRIQLIERNRLWLVWKHFPLWLVVLNPFWFGVRLAAGFWAALQGKGEGGQFGGFRAKMDLGRALLEANLEAWKSFGVMWRKRREWRLRRKLNDRELVELIRRHRIRLRALSENLA
jgi:GT2 family glycosyltransferase